MDPATATLLLMLSAGALASLLALYVAIPYPTEHYPSALPTQSFQREFMRAEVPVPAQPRRRRIAV